MAKTITLDPPKRRTNIGSARRAAVDGINTHCGFIVTPGMDWTFHQSINRACDTFFAHLGMAWVPAIQDYR